MQPTFFLLFKFVKKCPFCSSFLFLLRSFVNKKPYHKHTHSDKEVTQLVAVFGNFGQELCFALNARNGSEVVADSRKDSIPQTGTDGGV